MKQQWKNVNVVQIAAARLVGHFLSLLRPLFWGNLLRAPGPPVQLGDIHVYLDTYASHVQVDKAESSGHC